MRWLENELGLQEFASRMREPSTSTKQSNSVLDTCFKDFLQPLREERLSLDYLQSLNHLAFNSANAKQKLLALLLKDLARMAMMRLRVIAAVLTQKEHYRLSHAAKASGFEEKALTWLDEMRKHPSDYASLNLSSIQRNLEVDIGLYYDGKSVIDNFDKDMDHYLSVFKKENFNAYKGHFNHQWEEAFKQWQKDTRAQMQEVCAACEKPNEISRNRLSVLIQKAQQIIPADREEMVLALPKRRQSRVVGWLKTAAFVLAGAAIVGATAAAIVVTCGAATPIIVAVVASAAVIGGGLAYGSKRGVDHCVQSERAKAVGDAKRAADREPLLKSSTGDVHGKLGTTKILTVGTVEKEKERVAPVQRNAAALQNASSLSADLNQNLRYSVG